MVLVSGSCPNVTFLVGIQQVVTDSSTDYKRGNCTDLRTGRVVKVEGLRTSGVVRATKIELKRDD